MGLNTPKAVYPEKRNIGINLPSLQYTFSMVSVHFSFAVPLAHPLPDR
jgi:hypothetical protein